MLLETGFVDIFRQLNPNERKYTFWNYRGYARNSNKGWRVDYFVIDSDFTSKVTEADIYTNVMGSDHCPIYMKMINTELPFRPLNPKELLDGNNLINGDYPETQTSTNLRELPKMIEAEVEVEECYYTQQLERKESRTINEETKTVKINWKNDDGFENLEKSLDAIDQEVARRISEFRNTQ